MAKAYYASSIRDFLNSTPITVHGHILIQDEMRATPEQKNVWRDEITILLSKSTPHHNDQPHAAQFVPESLQMFRYVPSSADLARTTGAF